QGQALVGGPPKLSGGHRELERDLEDPLEQLPLATEPPQLEVDIAAGSDHQQDPVGLHLDVDRVDGPVVAAIQPVGDAEEGDQLEHLPLVLAEPMEPGSGVKQIETEADHLAGVILAGVATAAQVEYRLPAQRTRVARPVRPAVMADGVEDDALPQRPFTTDQ